MPMKSDWKLTGWDLEAPAGGPGDLQTGRPAVTFESDAGLTVRITFTRTAEVAEVCYSGSIESGKLPHVAKLTTDGRAMVGDWLIAYAASRPPLLQQREAAGLKASWPLADLAEAFAPPARPGRSGNSDTVLAGQAAIYVRRCVEGGEKLSAVARDLGIEQSTFSTQLRAARARGLLAGAPRRGEVAGYLLPAAEQLLAAKSEPGRRPAGGPPRDERTS